MGVQQGSILSPLLFNCFINDLLVSNFSNFIVAYADDLKFFGSPGPSLQNNLQIISNWTHLNRMKVNTTKCETLHINAKNPRISYSCEGLVIPIVTQIRDLRLIVDEKLSFREHSIMIKQKSLKLIAMIFKTFISSNINLYLLAYRTYVLPLLDYCSIFYSHNSASNTAIIEKVQRIFTSKLYLKISSLTTFNYSKISGLFAMLSPIWSALSFC